MMRGLPQPEHVLSHPYRTLTAAFAVWKLFLFTVAVGSSVGDAYDTSAALAVLGNDESSSPPTLIGRLATRFASWDAIYFVSAARRGYLFEQEWAFGTALPLAIRGIIAGTSALYSPGPASEFLTKDISPLTSSMLLVFA